MWMVLLVIVTVLPNNEQKKQKIVLSGLSTIDLANSTYNGDNKDTLCIKSVSYIQLHTYLI